MHRLDRHLKALKTVGRYREAFLTISQNVEWGKLESFFAGAIEHGVEEIAHHYYGQPSLRNQRSTPKSGHGPTNA